MTFWFLLLFLTVSVFFCKSDYSPDIQKILDHYKYDPECVFNFTVLNSKTIGKFPKCATVYGLLVINNNTDLTVGQIKKGLSSMTRLNGGVRIENTTFQNISFFRVPSDYVSFNVELYGFHVRNNMELTDARMLYAIYIYLYKTRDEVEFRIENNPKLDAKTLCEKGYLTMYTEMIVQGNLRDFACPGGVITSETIAKFKTCENIFNGIILYNISDTIDLSGLSTVEYIRGIIDIQDTNLQNLSFFENLADLKVNNYHDNQKLVLNLKNNPRMTRLGFPMLMEIQNSWSDGVKLANFENLHPDFCLTIEEMAFLAENQVSFLNLQAKICADDRTFINDNKICYFKTMSELEYECNVIMGDLIINSGDEDDYDKTFNVRYIFGSLSIQNTSLNAFPFYDLRYIIQLDDTYPVIQIVGNKEMDTLSFNDAKNLVTRQKRNAVIQDNHPDLFKDANCTLFTDLETSSSRFRMNLNYTGGNCGRNVEIDYRSISSGGTILKCEPMMFLMSLIILSFV